MNVQNTEARNVFNERSEHRPLRPVRSRGERSFILYAYDDLKKSVKDSTLEHSLFAAFNID